MLDFPLGIALYNFVPVLLMGLALWFIACFVRDQDAPNQGMALIGGGLILAGGLSKATWKLVVAATGDDIGWLANALFPLMAPGFVLLAVAIWGGARRLRGRWRPDGLWRVALAAILLAFAAAVIRQWVLEIPRGWFTPLLMLASLGNLGASILLISLALHLRRRGVALLFAINLFMIFALQPIAMATPKTLAMHWIEQSLTAIGTGCLALAAYLLWRLSVKPLQPPSHSRVL